MGRTRNLGDLPDEELRGRRVLARMDYNLPLTSEGEVADPTRVDATLPTLNRLREAGSRVVLVSHLGRPRGEPDPRFSLGPVAGLLSARLGAPVPLLDDPPGSQALAERVGALEPGGFALLENIRFHPGETGNEPELAAALGELADHFVGDAFGTAHRAHASNVGAPRVIRARGGAAVAGALMERELRFLGEAIRAPTRPFVTVLGGAKISGKLDLIQALLPVVDRLLIGGAMANTFLRALGLEVGRSLLEEDRVEMARDLLERAGGTILLPVDCVVAGEIEEGALTRNTPRDRVAAEDRIGDIGPVTRELFQREIQRAGTCLWNGPMGVFELEPFASGTVALAQALADATDRGVVTIAGGGDSAAAAEAAGVAHRLTHLSTGGGASLELLAGRVLPGVEVLETVDGNDASREGAGG